MEDIITKIVDFIEFIIETIKNFVATVSGKETESKDNSETTGSESTDGESTVQ